MLSKDMVEAGRANAEHNIALLTPYARAGIPIIGIEPSCLLTIRADYPKLVPGKDSALVAQQCMTIEEFLAQHALDDNGEPSLKFSEQPRQLLLHGHCHQKALIGTQPAIQALTMPKAFDVQEIPSGCCGMAGSNGFECEHYERSLEAAEEVLLPAVRAAGPAVEVVASGISCRQQIAHGTDRKARHPAEVLSEALLKASNG